VKVWKVILAALVIFSAGMVTGALTVNLDFREPVPRKTSSNNAGQRPRSDFATRMQRELALSPEQKEQIDVILRESKERSKKIWESANEEHRNVRENIRGVLTPDQRKQFEETFKNRGPHKPGDSKKEDPKKPDDRRGQSVASPSKTNPMQAVPEKR
jgi:hypothetical protein